MWKLLAAILLCSSAFGVEIQVPTDPVGVGDDLDLLVNELELQDTEGIVLTYWPEKGVVRCKFVYDLQLKTPVVEFRAEKEGEYKILLCGVVGSEHVHSDVVVIVGPQVPPLPDRLLRTVLVVEEMGEDRTGYYSIVNSLKVAKWMEDHELSLQKRDLDMKDPVTGKTPEDWKKLVKELTKADLPKVFFLDGDNEVVWKGSMPKSEELFLKLIQDYTEDGDE